MDDSAGGSASLFVRTSGEDVITLAFLVFAAEPLRLQFEHRPVAAVERHQLLMRAELDDPPLLQHADAVDVAHRRKAMRNEDRRAVARGREETLEDLGFATDVQLRGRL